MYGLKTEFSVRLNGINIASIGNYTGSVNYINIMSRYVDVNRENFRKSSEEWTADDYGIINKTYKDILAVLVDKGYQGSEKLCVL